MTDAAPAPGPDAPAPKRPTPWSVLVVAGLVFALSAWLFHGVWKESRALEAARLAPRSAAPTARPKLLGRDIIPQEGLGVPAGSAEPSASAAPGGSASGSPAASASNSPAPGASGAPAPGASGSPAASASSSPAPGATSPAASGAAAPGGPR